MVDNTFSFSTVIPAFNSARFIKRALNSVLRQRVPNGEIIVVDDGSTDDTIKICEAYADVGVKLIRHPENRGVAAARNTGIAAANSEFVAFLDADDEWHPSKIEKQYELINLSRDTVFVGCRADLISENGVNKGDLYNDAPLPQGLEGWRTLMRRASVVTSSVFARRNALLAVGSFNGAFSPAEDQDMWIRMALVGNVDYVNETLVNYFDTPNSLSKTGYRHQANVVLPMIKGHIQQNTDRLSRREVRAILANRYGAYGRIVCSNCNFVYGSSLIIQGMYFGDGAVRNLLHIAKYSPVGRLTKYFIK